MTGSTEKTDPRSTVIAPGTVVLVNLRQPREQLWGMLLDLAQNGIQLRGLPLASFDDFLRWVGSGGSSSDPGPTVSTIFVPLSRLEKIYLDEPSGAIRSYHQRFFEAARCSDPEFLQQHPPQQ